MRCKPCFIIDCPRRSRHCLNENPLIFNASTRRMMTTDASAVIWENRPTWSWLPLSHSIATYHQERNEKKPTHYHLPRRRYSAAPSGTAPAEEKPLDEYLSILQRSDHREAGASGDSQMKTITIRLPDVEAAMLLEAQKRRKDFRDLQSIVLQKIRLEYESLKIGWIVLWFTFSVCSSHC